ncbi:MAG: L-fuculose phosphate aldolase [Alphaproteobacteria bacterium MarineAlpha11_Bin1]|nr:MAG: L-fuculose phosphate aldolase [Alphaproteobacteria bacterium MarineAlpha11_Bin1]|tara:strand:- start:1473 stop:2186 length:714 start_codon:yes stop_codon:yes gene_type:complete
MSNLDTTIEMLVTANRIVAHENVCDSYGHVSIRHPDDPNRYLLAFSKAPSLIEPEDIVTFELDGTPINLGDRTPYSERAIHGAIYEQRPDVHSVVHNHSYQVVPFTVSSVQLQPIIHVAARIGDPPPTWDIRDRFGDETIMLVTTMEQGRDMCETLGAGKIVLMRGHGATIAGYSLEDAVLTSIFLQVNAQIQLDAIGLGGSVEYLSEGEIEARRGAENEQAGFSRAWEHFSRRAGR